MYLCTQENKEACPLLSRFYAQGVGTEDMKSVIAATSPELPTECVSNGPVMAQKGKESPWLRCGMHPEVIIRVGAIASAIEAGVIAVTAETTSSAYVKT